MAFTTDNTNGSYSTQELTLLNEALESKLAEYDRDEDPDLYAQLIKTFSDRIHNNFLGGGMDSLGTLTAW
jgi:hypothetical protein